MKSNRFLGVEYRQTDVKCQQVPEVIQKPSLPRFSGAGLRRKEKAEAHGTERPGKKFLPGSCFRGPYAVVMVGRRQGRPSSR
jgi:hypothetical protein